jgi:hypothetical protein
MDKFCLYILIKCIFNSVDIIFKLFVKYLNYFEVSKKIEVFFDLFFSPFIFLPNGKSPLLWRYVTHLSIVVFKMTWTRSGLKNLKVCHLMSILRQKIMDNKKGQKVSFQQNVLLKKTKFVQGAWNCHLILVYTT